MFFLAVTLALLGTAGSRRLAVRYGVFDRPDQRKVHRAPVPYLGGLGIYAAFLVYGIICWLFLSPIYERGEFPDWFPSLMAAGALVVGAGVYDDIKGVSAWVKFPIQTLALLILYFTTDLRISTIAHPFGGWIEFGPLTIVATLGWGLLLINAINLIDGLDGLAAGVVAISCLFLFTIDLIQISYFHALLPLGLAGVCAGFLRFNFAPARIFMGDAGSMFLGLILAVFSMDQRVKGTTMVTLIFPLLVLGIPIIDTGMAFLRRLSQGKHPFQGDARHIHHRFLAMGLNDRQVVLLIYFFCIVFGLFALVMIKLTPAYRLATLTLLLMLISFVILAMKYLEARFLDALAEVNAYKEWVDYYLKNGDKPPAAVRAAGEEEGPAPPAGVDRREYDSPAISRRLVDKLIRAEEQRAENVLLLASQACEERLKRILDRGGHSVIVATSASEAQEVMAGGKAGVAIVEDSELGKDASSFVANSRLTNPKSTILVLAGSSDDEKTLELLRLGAYSILPACATDEALKILINNSLEARFLSRRLDFLAILFWIFAFTVPVWIVIGRFIALGKFY